MRHFGMFICIIRKYNSFDLAQVLICMREILRILILIIFGRAIMLVFFIFFYKLDRFTNPTVGLLTVSLQDREFSAIVIRLWKS